MFSVELPMLLPFSVDFLIMTTRGLYYCWYCHQKFVTWCDVRPVDIEDSSRPDRYYASYLCFKFVQEIKNFKRKKRVCDDWGRRNDIWWLVESNLGGGGRNLILKGREMNRHVATVGNCKGTKIRSASVHVEKAEGDERHRQEGWRYRDPYHSR